jgi:hypothetical protein
MASFSPRRCSEPNCALLQRRNNRDMFDLRDGLEHFAGPETIERE